MLLLQALVLSDRHIGEADFAVTFLDQMVSFAMVAPVLAVSQYPSDRLAPSGLEFGQQVVVQQLEQRHPGAL